MARKKKGSTPKADAKRKPQAPGWHAAWSNLQEWQQHAVCLGLLLALSLGFFAPIHFSDKRIVGGDTVQWQASAQAMLEYQEQTGRPALWDPNMFGGMPGFKVTYAPVVPQVDDVLRLLRKVIWPTSHFIFLLIGTYLLLVFLTGDKLSGLLAASAYGLTTYLPILLIAGHNSKFIALCMAPWLVLAFAYALRRPTLLAALLFAAALAVNVRAGHEQITYYLVFLCGVWWVVEGVGAWREGRLGAFGASTGWLVLGAALTLLMVAQPHLAILEHTAYTTRGSASGGAPGGLDWTYAMAWSQGVGELFTLLIADAYGGSGLSYWGPKTFTSGPHYVGGIVFLLAVLALWRLRLRAVWALGLGGFLMLLFSLGENLPALNRLMFDYFPLFSAWRVPETWLSVVAMTLAVLAGLGLYYAARPGDDGAEKTRSVYVALGGLVGLVLVLFLMKDAFFDFQKPGEEQLVAQQVAVQNNVAPNDPRVVEFVRNYVAETRVARADRFGDDALRTLLFLVLAGLALVAHRRGMVPAWAMQLALAVLLVVDLWGVDRRYLNKDSLVQADTPADQIQAYGFDRYILEQSDAAGGPGHFRVLSLEGDVDKNARPSYFYESLSGYHGAKLRLYQDYLDHILFAPGERLPNTNALSLMNTRYVVSPVPLPGMERVYQDEQTGFGVYRNAAAVPRAFFVGQTEVVASSEETWQRIRSPEFDPRRTALLPEALDFATTPLDSSSTAEAELLSYSPREITWRVRTDAPRLLVVSEVYYPAGWTAYLDDAEVPIYRADYLLRAVPVAAGEHTLRMRFDPRSHTVGVWVSALATLLVYGGILGVLGVGYVRRRRDASAGVGGAG